MMPEYASSFTQEFLIWNLILCMLNYNHTKFISDSHFYYVIWKKIKEWKVIPDSKVRIKIIFIEK